MEGSLIFASKATEGLWYLGGKNKNYPLQYKGRKNKQCLFYNPETENEILVQDGYLIKTVEQGEVRLMVKKATGKTATKTGKGKKVRKSFFNNIVEKMIVGKKTHTKDLAKTLKVSPGKIYMYLFKTGISSGKVKKTGKGEFVLISK